LKGTGKTQRGTLDERKTRKKDGNDGETTSSEPGEEKKDTK